MEAKVELKKELIVQPESNYGRVEYTPRCELSATFVRLLGQKRLTQKNVDVIKEMGFVVRTEGRVL
jgi:hypothetical protein